MNATKIINYGSIILCGLGLAMICIGTHTKRKADKAIKRLNDAVDDLADKTTVEVSESIIKKAAEKAAEKAADEAIDIVRKDIKLKVSRTVSTAYEKVEDDVRARLSKEIERDVDMDEFKKSVTNKASTVIVSKFMNNLEDYANPIMSCIMNAHKEKERQK